MRAALKSPRHPDALAGALAALLSFAIAAVALRIWRADLQVPLVYSGDSLFVLSITKAVVNHAWYLTNDSLGAPFGQHLQDFPVASGDPIHLLALKVLGPLTGGDYPVAYNVYFLLGFPLAAVSCFVAMRAFAISRWVAVTCAVLFSVLPFHFTIGAARPFETGYWVIPISCYLILAVSEGRELFARNPDRSGARAWLTRRSLLTLLLCIVAGSAGIVYFSLFTAILLVVACALAAVGARSARAALPGAVVVGLIGATILVNGLPTVVYQLEHGNVAEEAALHRPADSELYSLNLAQLLLPIPGDRIEPLAKLRNEYSTQVSVVPTVSKEAGLGPIAALGLLFLIGLAVAGAAGVARNVRLWDLPRRTSALAVSAVLIGTTGGFSALIALLISPTFRVWQRFYIFIAFFSLLAVAWLLDRALARWATGNRAVPLTVGVLALVLVVGALGQTNDSYIPDYKAEAASWRSDERIVSEIDRRLPADAQVFQLPYMSFPSWGAVGTRGRTQGFDGFRPELHPSDLRWSYGATRGRAEDWQASIVNLPANQLLTSLVAAGFDGVLVNRIAYDDDASRLDAAIPRISRAAPLISPDRRYAFFDLRAYRARLAGTVPSGELAALGEATLRPVRLVPDSNLQEYRQYGSYTPTYGVEARRSTLTAKNPADTPRSERLTLALTAPPGIELQVTLPDGRMTTLTADRPLHTTVAFPPGNSEIELSAPAGVAARGVYVVALAGDSSLTRFAPSKPGGAVNPQMGRSEQELFQPAPGILTLP